MKKRVYFSFILLCSVLHLTAQQPGISENKKQLLATIAKHEKEMIRISDSIWTYAETAFGEHQSAQILADYAEKNGFSMQRNVAEMPTAFIASYGTGKPIIAVLGEYDALPGLSQKTVPGRDVRVENAPGKNLFANYRNNILLISHAKIFTGG
jgi:aminobenzoyl-glutamate utilization protein B